uniref:C-type lectin domain-containing protein n=1 Tax=Macrostomum lignano TaxID=282301 RepID=A0A1I8FB44_9PLAT
RSGRARLGLSHVVRADHGHYLMSPRAPFSWLQLLQTGSVPLTASGKLWQAWYNYRNSSTGQLSLITCLLLFLAALLGYSRGTTSCCYGIFELIITKVDLLAIVRFNSESGDCMSTADISCDDCCYVLVRSWILLTRMPGLSSGTGLAGPGSIPPKPVAPPAHSQPGRPGLFIRSHELNAKTTPWCSPTMPAAESTAADWIAATATCSQLNWPESVAYVLTGQEGYALFEG